MDILVLKKQWFINNKPGEISDYYDLQPDPIGSGGFATVLKGRLKGHTSESAWRAIKKIPKKKVSDKMEFVNQVNILCNLDHPNIIKLYQTFEDQRYIYMVTQLCTGGQLFESIVKKGYFTQEQARIVFKQMVLVLNYCHSQGVAHRDLKPQNFLLLNNQEDFPLKLIDFGLSVKFNKEKKPSSSMKSFVGTSYYMAPEVLKGIYDQRCDIWSIGVILYILVTGVPPFNGQNDEQIMDATYKMLYTFDIPEMQNISDTLKHLICRLLVKAPQRPSAEEVLEDQWLQKGASNEPLQVNLSRMKSFTSYSKLKKIAVMMIATQLPERDIFQLGKIFQSIDKNHDGELTLEEIRSSLINHTDKPALVEVQRILKEIDIDSNQKVNYTEFIASCMQNSLIHKQEHIHLAFKMIDKDQNGRITKQELRKILQTQPEYHFNQSLVNEVIKQCDKNGDGMIDYNQFLDAVTIVN